MGADAAVRLTVKVVPGASRSEISGWLGDLLKVRVAVQPEKGKANIAVETLLARTLNVPRDSVTIVSGKTSQKKTVEIRGISLRQVKRLLGGEAS